jgi:hypothetical protein
MSAITYGCQCVTQRKFLLKRQSVLFNPVRRLKHIFSVITKHLVPATRFTHQHFSTLIICEVRIVAAQYTW